MPARRVSLLLLAVVAAIVALATPAGAHATLVESVPADRAAVADPPPAVRLTFSEPVEAATGALRVFDADAERIDLGPIPTDDPAVVAVALPADLPAGGYVATYRVTSADSHVVAGVVTFTAGGGEAIADEVVAELFGGTGRGWPGVLGPLLRGLGYLGTLVAAGSVGIAAFVARRPERRASARRLAGPAAAVGIASALAAVPVQAAAVGGSGVAGAVEVRLLAEVLTTSFGWSTIVRLVGLVGLLVLWRPAADRSPRALVLPGVAAVVAVWSYLLDGHQRSVEPTAVLVAADAVHLAAGSVWFAGLVLLAGWLRRSDRADGTPTLVDPVGDAAVVARFSTVALVAVLAVAVSGTAMAAVLVRAPAALTTTAYGWTLSGKVGAVAVVVVLAAYNRRRLVPAVAGAGDGDPLAARHRLTTTVRAEALALVGVLLVTGTLVSRPPAALEAGVAGAYRVAAPLTDELTVDLVVDPNRAGRNALHLYVVEPTGRPTDQVAELRLELTYLPERIGPIRLELFPVGPGHWTGIVDDLTFPGAWELRVVAAVGAFDEAAATLTVPVAP